MGSIPHILRLDSASLESIIGIRIRRCSQITILHRRLDRRYRPLRERSMNNRILLRLRAIKRRLHPQRTTIPHSSGKPANMQRKHQRHGGRFTRSPIRRPIHSIPINRRRLPRRSGRPRRRSMLLFKRPDAVRYIDRAPKPPTLCPAPRLSRSVVLRTTVKLRFNFIFTRRLFDHSASPVTPSSYSPWTGEVGKFS